MPATTATRPAPAADTGAPVRPVAVYEVGGCVRDRLLGVPSTDIDYAVEAASFEHMHDFVARQLGAEVFQAKPEYFTLRARLPRTVPAAAAAVMPPLEDAGKVPTVDFVLCRRDGEYTDGRRPDQVHAGTIEQDLARRDFTINAIALAADGTLLDPHHGVADLNAGILRAVGDPRVRIAEDALRALRAIRFAVTKDLHLDADLMLALNDPTLPARIASLPANRRRNELLKTFAHDTGAALRKLALAGPAFLAAALGDDLWLKPTNETP